MIYGRLLVVSMHDFEAKSCLKVSELSKVTKLKVFFREIPSEDFLYRNYM